MEAVCSRHDEYLQARGGLLGAAAPTRSTLAPASTRAARESSAIYSTEYGRLLCVCGRVRCALLRPQRASSLPHAHRGRGGVQLVMMGWGMVMTRGRVVNVVLAPCSSPLRLGVCPRQSLATDGFVSLWPIQPRASIHDWCAGSVRSSAGPFLQGRVIAVLSFRGRSLGTVIC